MWFLFAILVFGAANLALALNKEVGEAGERAGAPDNRLASSVTLDSR